jgi:hypothetical protein
MMRGGLLERFDLLKITCLVSRGTTLLFAGVAKTVALIAAQRM